MRVLVQWTLDNPGDWEEVDSVDWAGTPARAKPRGGERLDSTGYVYALNVQGVVFGGYDHYAVEHLGQSIRVSVWNDDPDDWPEGTRHGQVWSFQTLAANPAKNGAIDTRQSREVYTEDPSRYHGEVSPWADFPFPPERVTRHGVWTADALSDEHASRQSVRGWREWTDGLDASELGADGRVLPQRAQGRYVVPDGTRTYYHSVTSLATGLHAADFENELASSPSGASDQQSTNAQAGDVEGWASTTPSNEPDSAAWPTGNYRCQMDVTATDANLQIGLLTLGTAVGHFARVNAALSSELETKDQAESAFTGTGLKLATTGSVSWSSGTASDRFEITIAIHSTGGHGQQKVTLQLDETDDFCDGPWEAPAAPPDNAVFFGCNF